MNAVAAVDQRRRMQLRWQREDRLDGVLLAVIEALRVEVGPKGGKGRDILFLATPATSKTRANGDRVPVGILLSRAVPANLYQRTEVRLLRCTAWGREEAELQPQFAYAGWEKGFKKPPRMLGVERRRDGIDLGFARRASLPMRELY